MNDSSKQADWTAMMVSKGLYDSLKTDEEYKELGINKEYAKALKDYFRALENKNEQ